MTKDLTVSISGMHCGACVSRVTQALKNIPGVGVEDVQIGIAKVKYDDKEAGPAGIQAALREIGFEAETERGA